MSIFFFLIRQWCQVKTPCDDIRKVPWKEPDSDGIHPHLGDTEENYKWCPFYNCIHSSGNV